MSGSHAVFDLMRTWIASALASAERTLPMKHWMRYRKMSNISTKLLYDMLLTSKSGADVTPLAVRIYHNTKGPRGENFERQLRGPGSPR